MANDIKFDYENDAGKIGARMMKINTKILQKKKEKK